MGISQYLAEKSEWDQRQYNAQHPFCEHDIETDACIVCVTAREVNPLYS